MLADRLQAHDRIEAAVGELQRAYAMRAAAGETKAADALKARILRLDPHAEVSAEGAGAGVSTPGATPHALPGLTEPEGATRPAPEPASEVESIEEEVGIDAAGAVDVEPEDQAEAWADVEPVEAADGRAGHDYDAPPSQQDIELEPTALDTTSHGPDELDLPALEGFESTQLGGGARDEGAPIDFSGLEGLESTEYPGAGVGGEQADDLTWQEEDEVGADLPILGEAEEAGRESAAVDDAGSEPVPYFDDDEETGEPLPMMDLGDADEPIADLATAGAEHDLSDVEESERVPDLAGDVAGPDVMEDPAELSAEWSDDEPAEDLLEPPATGVAAEDAQAETPPADEGTPADEGFVDLSALVAEDEQDADTRFVVAENAPTGDEDHDFAELLAQFKEKVSQNVAPEDAGSHYDLGLAFKEMGLLDEAIAEFQVALRGGHERLQIYEELGQCFMLKEEYNIALKVLQRALQVPYDDELALIGVHYHLGRVQEALGARMEAREAYERVLGLDIHFADVNDRLAKL
jgi:hypothetical protein